MRHRQNKNNQVRTETAKQNKNQAINQHSQTA
jgi:hypothetical protein